MARKQKAVGDDAQLGVRMESLLAGSTEELRSHEFNVATIECRIHHAVRENRPARIERRAGCMKTKYRPVVLGLDTDHAARFVHRCAESIACVVPCATF